MKLARRAILTALLGACLVGLAGAAGAQAFACARAGASAAAAEEEHDGGHGMLYRWINFIILVGGLGYLLRKPLKEFFTRRSASIQKSLEEGRVALEASQVQLKAVEEKLQRLEQEIAAFKAAAADEMAAEHERLRQTTAQEAEKMLESARVQMDTAAKAAMLDLKLFAAQQAVELAEQMIRQRLDDASRRRLVSQFIAKLENREKPN